MEQRKITFLMAHADDEFLFGWPLLKEASKLICCTDDLTHPTRQWCKRRSEGFKEIGQLIGVPTLCLRHDSGFAKKEHKELVKFVGEVQEAIKDADVIFTHNGWGEYGHLDHILLHQIARMSGKTVITTDTVMQADWYKVQGYNQGEVLGHYINNFQFHEQCMEIYRKYNAMGWTYQPIKECNVIRVQ